MSSVIKPIVESEQDVYQFEGANNGAGPTWCFGSTTLVRHAETLYASGLETIPGAKPLNNTRWSLYRRDAGEAGWTMMQRDEKDRTREPSPLAVFDDGRLFMSVNPTRTPIDSYSGPAEPQVLEFDPRNSAAPPRVHLPLWEGKPAFSEHSYRSFAADGKAGHLLLLNNIGHTHAHWSLMQRDDKWISTGTLKWPWGADYEVPEPIRLCYPSVAIVGKAVYFFGVSDIVEPNRTWREFKFQLTGQKWDYDFRRLFFAWTPDITTTPFYPWLEVASREETCGWTMPCDLYVADDGAVHLLWNDRSLDERLREKFFPDKKLTYSLEYSLIRDGKVATRQTLAIGGEQHGPDRSYMGRFHPTADGRLFIIAAVSTSDANKKSIVSTRLYPVTNDPEPPKPIAVPVQDPVSGNFFTATPRAGSQPSNTIDMFGLPHGRGNTLRHIRIRI